MRLFKSKRFFKMMSGIIVSNMVLFTTAADTGDSFHMDKFSLPPLKNKPVIDGKIDAAEWQGAVKADYFSRLRPPRHLDPREGSVRVGYDNDNLYLAVSSECPPGGKLVSTVKVKDGPTIYDDSLEIWLDPFLSERQKRKCNKSYFQFIGNSLGTVFDQEFKPGAAPNDSWNGNWQFCNSINKETNSWEAELCIPWKSLGIKPHENITGRKIGLLISRNWKQPGYQTTWMNCKKFSDPLTYPAITLDENAPVVQLDTMGNIFKGKFAPEVSVFNPSNEKRDVYVEFFAKHSDMPEKTYSESAIIEPGQKKLFKCKEKGDGFHPDAEHTVTTRVLSKDKKQSYFEREIGWKYPVNSKWRLLGMNQDTGIMLAYYPSYNKLRVKADIEAAVGKQAIHELKLEILGENQKKLTSKTFMVKENQNEFILEIPDLDDGSYTLKIDFLNSGNSQKTLKRTFDRKHFPWENNRLGMTEKVYPPFTAVKVKGNTVSVVLRDYRLGKLGLPKSIVAEGNEILASDGMTLNYLTSEGNTGSWQNVSGNFLKTNNQEAVYEGKAESPDVNIKLKSTIEYDGCTKVQLSLLPGKNDGEIKELYLDIPMKAEFATLWHICQASLRSNAAGKIPKGNGVIWDSTKTGNGPFLGNFLPYIWLGREVEGLAWFADNDKNWSVDDKTPVQKIIIEKGNVILRVYFINKPTIIEKEKNIVFGWQVSPTKPMPEDWRKPKTRIPMHGGSNAYWGIRPAYAGKYPAGRDYTFVDQLLIARKRAKSNRGFLTDWYKKHYSDVTDNAFEKNIKAHISGGMNKASGAGRKKGNTPNDDVLMLYIEEHCQDQTTPEWNVFQDEWGCKDYTSRKWLDKLMLQEDATCGIKISPSKSYQDFVLWEAKEWLLRGIGLYCDNCFFRQTTNREMTNAYEREDGNIQLSAAVWDMREYHKRMWVLTQQCKELTEYPLYVSLHMTNTQLLPINTWCDINLDIEWCWDGGNKPFPADLLRAETLGRKTGCYPHALHQTTVKNWYLSSRDKNGRLTPPAGAVRHEWGIRMVHEIYKNLWGMKAREYPLEKIVRKFGYGDKTCRVFNYWEKDYPVKISSSKVKSIVFENKGKVMIVLTSWLDRKSNVTIELKNVLSKYKSSLPIDPETGKNYQENRGEISVPLDQYGVRLVELGVNK